MYGVGVAKEVVHIAQNLLISTHEEYTQIVGLILLQRVYGQRVGVMTVGCEVSNLSVAITGDILDGGVASGSLVEALDGHNREYLVDGP